MSNWDLGESGVEKGDDELEDVTANAGEDDGRVLTLTDVFEDLAKVGARCSQDQFVERGFEAVLTRHRHIREGRARLEVLQVPVKRNELIILHEIQHSFVSLIQFNVIQI